MIRNLSLAAVVAVAFVLPAIAEDSKIKIEPGTGPTSTMTDQVPQMKERCGSKARTQSPPFTIVE